MKVKSFKGTQKCKYNHESTHYGSNTNNVKCVDDTLSFDRPRFNLCKPGVHFVGYRQTVQTELRRRRMRCVIRVSIVCLQNALLDFNVNEKYHPITL